MNFSEERLRIDTPENVIFGYEVAGIGSRFMAALIDSFLIIILQLITAVSFLLLSRLFEADEISSWLVALLGLFSFGLLWGYYIFFETHWNGQSPGKWRVGLRVIRIDGTPITLTESLIRNLVRIIDFLPVGYGVGVVTMFVQAQSRRLGDLAAGTIVVHEQTAINLDDLDSRSVLPLPTLTTPPPLESGSFPLPVERLTPADLQLAKDFLQRQREIPSSRVLAQKILASLYARMGVSPSSFPTTDPTQTLIKIVHASQQREASNHIP